MIFKFRKGVLMCFCVMALFFAFFAINGLSREGFNAGNCVFVLLLVFWSILASKAYVISMDIVVEDDGICRIFSGRRVFFLKWSDIKVVRDFIGKSLGGPILRSFYIIPRDGVSLSFWSGGWIRFTDSMHDFPAFVDVMNKQARSHNIRIERVRGVDIEVCDEIFVSDRGSFKIP